MLAVITGASSGIGKELAYQLADIGYDLILIARRKDRLKEIQKDLSQKNTDVKIYDYDLQSLEACRLLVNNLKNEVIDIFVNNAGFGTVGSSTTVDTNREFQMIDLNIKSLHYLTKELLEIMKTGMIINISSMASFLPTPLLSSYAATKAYVYSYSRALAYELKKEGRKVMIMTVCPGPVKTEFSEVANASPKMQGITVQACVKSIIKGIKKRKAVVIPSFKMKFLRFLIRFIPERILLGSAYKIQSKK